MQCAGFSQRREELQCELQRFAARLQKDVVLPALEEHRRVLQCEFLQPALAELRAQVAEDITRELNGRYLSPTRSGGSFLSTMAWPPTKACPSPSATTQGATPRVEADDEEAAPISRAHLHRFRRPTQDMISTSRLRAAQVLPLSEGWEVEAREVSQESSSESDADGIAEEVGLASVPGVGNHAPRSVGRRSQNHGGTKGWRHCIKHHAEAALGFANWCKCQCRNVSEWLVDTGHLDYVSCTLIILNAIFLGVQTDYLAKNLNGKPMRFLVTELLFCIFFILEVAVRCIVYKWEMFSAKHAAWTLFDIVVLVCQTTDLCLEFTSSATAFTNMSFLRLMRVFRLLRVLRLVRLLHLIELRSIFLSICGSMRALFGVVLLYFVLVFTAGTFFTEVVAEARMDSDGDEPVLRSLRGIAAHGVRGKPSPAEVKMQLELYYGGLGTTIMSLWECISGGLDWKTLFDPLMEGVSPWVALVFLAYVVFATVAMMNVATGVFVDNAMKYAERDQDIYLTKNIISIFETSGLSQDGEITLASWEAKMGSPEMTALFQALNVDPSDTQTLFKLIDIDDSGSLCLDELIDGWVRLRGQAKSLDLALLMRESDRSNQAMRKHLRVLEDRLNWLIAAVAGSATAEAEPAPQEATVEDSSGTSPVSSRRPSAVAGSEDGRPPQGGGRRGSAVVLPVELSNLVPPAAPAAAADETPFRAQIRPLRRSVVYPRS